MHKCESQFSHTSACVPPTIPVPFSSLSASSPSFPLPPPPPPHVQVAAGAVLGKLAIYLAYDLLPRLQQATAAASPSPSSNSSLTFLLSSLYRYAIAPITLSASAHTNSETEKRLLQSGSGTEWDMPPAQGTTSPAANPSDTPVPERLAPATAATSVPVKPGIDPRTEALITAACAFGNSMTLPLVFLTALLPSAEADRAAGFLALFMVG